MLNFCQLLYHKKCQRRGVGGQKKPQNLVNVVCEPLRSDFPPWNRSTYIPSGKFSKLIEYGHFAFSTKHKVNESNHREFLVLYGLTYGSLNSI